MSRSATEWHTLDMGGGTSAHGLTSSSTLWHFTTSLTLSAEASWGYAVAVVIGLLSASVWMHREQARDALDLLDDTDETG